MTSSSYDMVWAETSQTYRDMVVAENWQGKTEIEIPVIQKLTFKLALLIIGKCGFGFEFNWFDPPKSADGAFSIQEAIRIVADTNIQAVNLPKWIRRLPFKKCVFMYDCLGNQLRHIYPGFRSRMRHTNKWQNS